ncbi:glycosyltransferase family 2 protein [Rhizobium gallicum]|uniref:Glycosyltransferase family 2 protein n=1 Tax=Rhizobium gallicum TaxID=56730 RepID=A0A1L5NHZ2_9HYPH|nr:glycosyltransferase [Rhizobium gallicum]APO67484.1 glycosyltransferase family 2 protein [Rhizobium gallicum]
MPRISICIPAFKPGYFELCLKSALSQSFQDVEILVSDDCPTEEIREICDKFGSFISYSRNPSPGLESNVRRLVQVSNGEYIKFLFDDDVLHPFCVQFLFETMEATKARNTKLAFSPRYFIDEHNHGSEMVNPFKAVGDVKLISGSEFIKLTAINHHNFIGEFTTVLFRREDCFDEAGEFRLFRMVGNEFDGLTDLSSFFELACLGNFAVHPKPLSYFRRHSAATSNHVLNPRFIVAVTYYETLLNAAFERGYLSIDDLPVAYRNLLTLYRSWVNVYPQLRQRMDEIEMSLPNR